MRIYRRKALVAHQPMIMIVSGYTLARDSYMAKPDQIAWVPTCLFENTSLSLPKESVSDLSDLVVMWEVIVFFKVLTRPCSLVWHVLFLSMSQVGWWFPPRCAPGRGLWPSAIVSLWRFKPRFSVCGMLGKPYRPDGGSHICGKVCGVFCRKLYLLSEGCVCVCPPL